MNWDFTTWIAMILLGAPVATLAVVHKVEWGGLFAIWLAMRLLNLISHYGRL